MRSAIWLLGALAALRHRLKPWRDPIACHDLLIANSEFVAHHVRLRWDRDPAVVHPSSPMQTQSLDPHRERERSIVTLGRITRPEQHVPNKRHDVLIEAFISSDLSDRGWTLHVAGSCGVDDAEYADELEQRSAGANVRVHRNAPREELDALLAASSLYWHAQGFGEDVSTHPEAHEHFGISVVEAMAAGLVPVVYGVGGPVEITASTGATWMTVDDLLSATNQLISAPSADLDAQRAEARRRAEQFSDQSFRRRVGQLTLDLIDSHGA